MPVYLLAILTPKPHQVARLEEIARELSTYVQENESDTLTYQWFRTGTPEEPKIAVFERYTDNAALERHLASPAFARFMETEQQEGNLEVPPQLLPLEHFLGFADREGAKI